MRFHFSCTRNPHTERAVYTMRTPRLRLLSAILAVALFFTLLPVSALAEGGGSNANTGLTIGIVGNLNHWDESHSISMKEVSPAVYEVTFENKSYGDINGSVGFLFVKDNSWDNSWGFGTVSSGELHNAVYKGDYITINPGSDAEESTHNFIIRLDLTNWDWDTKMGATFTVTVAAATNTFYFDPTTGTITKYVESDTVVVIPSKINGVTVETIGHAAFEKSAVTSVTIPDSVTAILDRAFANCFQLTNISIPNSVTSIGFSAFEHCTSLKSITLPSSLRNISMFLFHNCSQLTTIQIPDSVPSIQDYAFGNCISLETIHIPVSVTSIGNRAFAGCPSSMTVTYSGSKKQWDSITGKDELLNIPLVCNKLEATFNPDNGDPTVTKFIDNDKNSKFAELVPEPTKENYTFAGWYNGNEKFDFTTVPTGDVTLTAKWNINQYTVKFVSDYGSFADQTIEHGKPIDTGKLTIPEVEGYTFDGWYAEDNTKFDFTQPIKRNTTVYAKWTAKDYEVSFVTEHGKAPTSQNVPYNGTADDPGTLSAEGYTFDGWYTDDTYSTEFKFSTPITSNTTVYAKWTAKDYEVSFVTEHGKAPTSQNVKYNGTATDPGKLTEEGYTFIGWYTDAAHTTEFKFSTPITGDTKVYAKWEKNAPVFPDTYALNVSGAFVYVDGVDVTASAGDTSLKLEKNASVRLVADPDRMPSGMVFDRWTILNGALNADDAEKFETGRTLEEFAFTMPAEPLSIEATPRMQEEEGSDTASVILGVTLGTAATALVAWQAYDLGMSLYQEHWLPADFVMPKTRAELALLLWNTAGRPAPAAQPAFTDIPDPDTAQAAQWAVETGLMTPKSADLFKPEKSVTRWKAVRSWKRVTNQNT